MEAAHAPQSKFDWSRLVFMLTGVALFTLVYFSPAWPDAIDPTGQHFVLSHEAKGALAVFLLAGTWWVFEVVPIGITSLMIGILQVMFLIRPAKSAFKDFMDPSVLFIFASIMIGLVFTKTGLTKRLAYKMLDIVGERTSMIYLGVFVVTAALTHIMAHTAVAATIYPLLLAIYALYGEGDKPTKFGKGLFIGMAYVAGAGSIVTLLGAARGAVAIGFFKEIVGKEVGFFELSYYMAPIGWLMVFLLWGFFMLVCKPEKDRIPGLREKARELNARMGSLTRNEIMAAIIVGITILIMSLRAFVPALDAVDKTAIILCSSVLFFIFKILDIKDLEDIPWNIILLFAGAMSIGFCLWETGAAKWMAVNWLVMFQEANWFVFVMSIAFFVMIMTNFIMNVAAIAISLPVALVIAPYLGVSAEVILYASLVTAGMPFLLLVGAAPNAIAYDSRQFTTGEFFKWGIPASIMLMVVVGLACLVIWPLMGMPITVPAGG
ncbi:MAG: SLC13 family permease [Pseudodesulfovibrio sp.]|uniref:Sodium/sulphate symporter n=1 Tax=Pseudodesulfovibrio aespoeensis (strain ATCC 700646 / DSM 10631 / Aspo-2) TaxID=643562 RepID=E6VT59_PSEA9|nr:MULTISPECIES: SLC13 family permease [Pseudodesulfovibrio]MBU4515920.1 SLC13 family permease [Pseudomonadota bacterium]ADU62109.1 sodium/sulphate symporter [Pseudodesulfovibrio aespoeensis Aspo-2]MBU4522878.1 SLC13 family permease [Pseudomonadota bacterium]MBU4560002.1 SLC13 family permease [Pseudomonadota bacterium]MBV1766289.1 SLC13 family permease [Pseudodesulfovibrio sp.]